MDRRLKKCTPFAPLEFTSRMNPDVEIPPPEIGIEPLASG